MLPVNVGDTICLGGGDRAKLGSANRILKCDPSVTRRPCDMRQTGATLMGLSTGLAHVCRTCPCNAEYAICHRHGVAPPPFSGDFSPAINYFSDNRESILYLFADKRAIWQDAWIDKWSAMKRESILKSVDDDVVAPDVVHVMVKREVLHDVPSKSRAIQFYPNLATQAAFGPEFFSLQKAYTEWFYRREVAPGIRVTFASGLNANALGDWMTAVLAETVRPHFYERDGKNWDSTMQRPHLDVRLAAYEVAGPDFRKFVEAGFAVRGKAPRGALRYKLTGTVKSGHNDTTLGNSIVNAVIAWLSMSALGLRGDIIVAGDDLLIVVFGDFDAKALADAERAFGIVPECRKFDNASDVSFVSGVWFDTGAGWAFTPKPGRLLARLFWTVHPPPPKKRLNYLNGVVLGLRPTCAPMPVVSAFLDAHYTAGVEAVSAKDKLNITWSSPSKFLREAFVNSFCNRYDLAPRDLEEAEMLLRGCRGKVGLLSHPVLTRIMEVDLASLEARPLSRL